MRKLINLPILIVAVLLIAISVYIGYRLGKNDTVTQNPSATPANTVNSVPTSNTSPDPRAFPGISPPSTSLEDCLNKVNQLDASSEVIQSFVNKCHEVY